MRGLFVLYEMIFLGKKGTLSSFSLDKQRKWTIILYRFTLMD